MGQLNVMGRYPFHFHMMGDVAQKSYFTGCSVQHSFFRAFTLHGTSSVKISQNIAYDIMGSAFYLEDGIEEKNIFSSNLAAFVHVIKPLPNYGGGQQAPPISSSKDRIVPTDATAAGFYGTNAHNRWIGNSASGGFVGFLFPGLPHALGLSYDPKAKFSPETRSLLEFRDNTAHSSGKYWSQGACIQLWPRNPSTMPLRRHE